MSDADCRVAQGEALGGFQAALREWFCSAFEAPTPVQAGAWPAISAGRHALLAAPTGSGKTLAGFLAVIDDLLRRARQGELPDRTQVVYVSPLRALSTDVRRNLEAPLAGIDRELEERGEPPSGITAGLRTGDSSQAERRRLLKRPPHILVTTPESLYLLLTAEGGRRMLSDVGTVVLDELHALAGGKRGAHLALTLERLQMLTGKPLRRIGMSATQRPLERMARFLLGNREEDCALVDAGADRTRDLALELPGSPLQAVMPLEVWAEIHDRVAALAREHDSTLVFVNTRRLCERVARQLSERLGEEAVASHHGSMSKEHRATAEQRLKSGRLKVLIATASLELGIDIGSVDLVCQLGSPRGISVFLQRVGRSGHAVGQTPKGRLFPLTRGELMESLALLKAAARSELEEIHVPRGALDVLAQQIVAECACGERGLAELHEAFSRAWPYRCLEAREFFKLAQMLAEGYATRRGRSGAYLHYDSVREQLRPRRAARITALTNGGTIPDQFDYDVLLAPSETRIGTLNEDFAFESLPGDIFQLGNASYRILRVASGKVYAEDAHGAPPTIPFWFGEAPGRSGELSQRVAALLDGVEARLASAGGDPEAWLAAIPGASRAAARQAVEYLAAGRATLGALPGQGRFVVERFLDELGDMHVVIHSPLGSRLNRAWGLALRKRICRKFNIEPQAAALDDSIVISLGPGHSFPLKDIAGWLHSSSAVDVLTQAVLDSPMFPTRWRWAATTALAVLRNRNGERRPAQFQRGDAEDLMVALFPDIVACAENLTGDRAIPDHPLVRQTLDDCLHELMDAGGLKALLKTLEAGETAVHFAEPAAPSVLAQEVITAKPYAFLDDAPAEERRTQAIRTRHLMDAGQAARLAQPDPQAIADVCAQAWPRPRDADELHDALNVAGFMTEPELAGHAEFLDELAAQGRAIGLSARGGMRIWGCVERGDELRAACGTLSETSPAAIRELLRSRLEVLGPVTAAELAAPLDLALPVAAEALAALEGEGFVVRGRFRSRASKPDAQEEWCERGLLARIHRRTLKSLRQQVKPVTAAEFTSFLFRWQGLAGERRRGAESLRLALARLEGAAAPAAAWEKRLLPARVEDFSPPMLDQALASGEWLWKRVEPAPPGGRGRIAANTPICLLRREFREFWPVSAARLEGLSFGARKVYEVLREGGADFFLSLARNTGLLRSQAEMALGELAAAGLVTSDSFTGLRALITRAGKRPRFGSLRARMSGVQAGGRWSALPEPAEGRIDEEERVRYLAETMIRRYGVVFRALLARERGLPPWRAWLRACRRMEARGELRGGRFVSGFSGEQFASPEAVEALRALRRRGQLEASLQISSADPMNLTGVLSPRRVPAQPARAIRFVSGEPLLGGAAERAAAGA